MKRNRLIFYLFSFSFLFSSQTAIAQTWSDVGSGQNGPFNRALGSYNGDLIVGGLFIQSGNPAIATQSIASWDGSAWSDLAGPFHWPAYINVLHSYNSLLFAAGCFDSVGGKIANSIASWNGTMWDTLSSGIKIQVNSSAPGSVSTMVVYNGDLYVGGYFKCAGGIPAKYIAKWNGFSWDSVGVGFNGRVQALAVYNGELYAGGTFTNCGNLNVNGIAKWNGTAWDSVRSGTNQYGEVFSLCVFNGELYACGLFGTMGGVNANQLAKWDGSVWTGIPNPSSNPATNEIVSYNGMLYASLDMSPTLGPSGKFIERWDGISWSSLGSGIPDYKVERMLVHNGSLYVAGDFHIAGGISVNHIARWDAPVTGIATNIIDEDQISIFPNPSNGEFIVSGMSFPNQITVYNSIGEKLIDRKQETENCKLDLPPGIYFLKIDYGEGEITKKMIIE